MEIGYCLLMVANDEDPLGARHIKDVKNAGFDYAEIPVGRMLELTEEEVEEYRGCFEKAGLPVKVFNGALSPVKYPSIGPNSTDAIKREYIEKIVSLAKKFGVKTITSCGPVEKMIPAGMEFDWEMTGRKEYISFLKMVSEACGKEGIEYLVEPICREEHGFISNSLQALEIVKEAGCENLGVIIDYYHYLSERETVDNLSEEVKTGKIRHIHFADFEHRYVPEEGREDVYDAMLRPLLSAGYNEKISVEAFSKDPKHEFPVACDTVRCVCRNMR